MEEPKPEIWEIEVKSHLHDLEPARYLITDEVNVPTGVAHYTASNDS